MEFKPAERPLRILMTADCLGGIWTYALELTRALASFDVEVVLATMGGEPSSAQREEAKKLNNLILLSSPLKLEWMEDPWEDVAEAGRWLLEIEQRLTPDLVHLNHYSFGTLPWETPVIVAAHSCIYTWWRNSKGENPPEKYRRYFEKVSTGLQGCHLLVAPTQAFLEEFRSVYGYSGRSLVIPNGRMPLSVWNVGGEKRKQIVAVGRVWDESKNFRLLDQIAESIEWPIFLAGDAVSPDGNRLTLSKVRHLGTQTPLQVAELLFRSAIYVHPAYYEPFGLSVLEAAAAGCALILSDLPSLRENWKDYALFFDPKDPSGLKDALSAVTEDAWFRKKLSDQALKRSRTLLPNIMAMRYFNAYREVLEISLNENRILLSFSHF